MFYRLLVLLYFYPPNWFTKGGAYEHAISAYHTIPLILCRVVYTCYHFFFCRIARQLLLQMLCRIVSKRYHLFFAG